MAEFLFRDMVDKKGMGHLFSVASSATSREEIGNGVHYGTACVLDRFAIDYSKKRAVQLTVGDLEKYDYFIGMDSANIRNMKRILNNDEKVFKLLEFCGEDKDVADPWYTGDFEETYKDVVRGCNGFLDYLKKEKIL